MPFSMDSVGGMHSVHGSCAFGKKNTFRQGCFPTRLTNQVDWTLKSATKNNDFNLLQVNKLLKE